MHHRKPDTDRVVGVQPGIRSHRRRRPNAITAFAALTLGLVSLALPGCASSSKPDENVSAGAQRGITPDRNLTARIVRIERSSQQTLVEIDAGERDGVQKDWIMTIADRDSFVSHLRIIDVDVHRATGVISLERGTDAVKVGQKVIASPDWP